MLRGEVYFVNLDPTKGRETTGTRPVLVLSNDSINKLPLVVTVIVGTKAANIPRDYPTNVHVYAAESGLPMDTVFLCFQIRSIDPGRFPAKPSGRLPENRMRVIEETVRYCLKL